MTHRNVLSAMRRERQTIKDVHWKIYHASMENLRATLALEFETRAGRSSEDTSMMRAAIVDARALCHLMGHPMDRVPLHDFRDNPEKVGK